MKELNLELKTREVIGKKVQGLRKQGEIPAVLYGHNVKPVNVTVNYNIFEKVFAEAGESTLISLSIDGKAPVKALVESVQFDPIGGRIMHIDFHQVRMDEKLKTKITLKFIGEAPAVKELSGIFVANLHEVEVECLPKDLVHEIEVDLLKLKTFNDLIHVSDVKVPAGITILSPVSEVLALVQPPRSEKELESLQEKPVEKLPEEAKEEPAKEEGAAEGPAKKEAAKNNEAK